MAGHGGKREGAGRKSKREEEKSRNLSVGALKAVFGSEEEAFKELATKAKDGSIRHFELLLSYAYGKPTQKTEAKIELGEGKALADWLQLN